MCYTVPAVGILYQTVLFKGQINRKGEDHMKKRVTRLICKFGVQLCAVAAVIAPLVSDICRFKYYQPEEPEGLDTFADSQRSKLRG